MPVARYLTHPQVTIDPDKDVGKWSLNDEGSARVQTLCRAPGVLAGTTKIVSSGETKAIETAKPLAEALGAELEIRQAMHENDRSATGYLPCEEFEAVADAFFADPSKSIRGWETAQAAQTRILQEAESVLSSHKQGDILFVGHGAVGTLLYCALSGRAIDRRYDQGAGGGGCWFEFDVQTRAPKHGWRRIEELSIN